MGYRFLQHPLVAWVAIPPVLFLLLYRLPFDAPQAWRSERRAVHLTNLALLCLVLGLSCSLRFRAVALVRVPITVMAATIGVWLFSVQHRFEQARWERQPSWHPVSAALQSCSYLKLPVILQWFTGNIGFHHIHPLNTGIPNYHLQSCHNATPALQNVLILRPWQTWKTWRYALWDEHTCSMVPFANKATDAGFNHRDTARSS